MLNICKTYDEQIFEKFTKDNDGFYYNERLERETARRKNFCESRRSNKLGLKTKNNICSTYVEHMETETENENKDIFHKGLITKFESLWTLYPKKDGKKAALRHFMASVKNPGALERVEKAVDNYIKHVSIQQIDHKYIKNGATFFNNWEDWVDYQSPEKRPAMTKAQKFCADTMNELKESGAFNVK